MAPMAAISIQEEEEEAKMKNVCGLVHSNCSYQSAARTVLMTPPPLEEEYTTVRVVRYSFFTNLCDTTHYCSGCVCVCDRLKATLLQHLFF